MARPHASWSCSPRTDHFVLRLPFERRHRGPRLRTFESFCRAAVWLAISVEFAADHFGEELGDCPQPKALPPVQGFPQDKLSTVGIVDQVQPIIDFAPIFDTPGNRCSGCSCIRPQRRRETPSPLLSTAQRLQGQVSFREIGNWHSLVAHVPIRP